jgi:hypothetical protein
MRAIKIILVVAILAIAAPRTPAHADHTGAHFPKSALHRHNTFLRTSESYGHQQIYDSSAAFDPKSLKPILQRESQGLRIGGTAPAATMLYLDQQEWAQASGEAKAALAIDFMRVFCGNPAMPVVDLVGCLDQTDNIGPIFEHALACIGANPERRTR